MAKIYGDVASLIVMDKISGQQREMPCKSGEDCNIDLGGYQSETQMNGNGSGHAKLAAKPWSIEGLSVEMEDGVLEFLQGTVNSMGYCIFTLSFVNGDVYKGTGKIEGDLKANTNSGYISLSAKGSGLLEKLA